MFVLLLMFGIIVFVENENLVLFSGSFIVINEGGKFQVGFVEIDFKKGLLFDGIDLIIFNV